MSHWLKNKMSMINTIHICNGGGWGEGYVTIVDCRDILTSDVHKLEEPPYVFVSLLKKNREKNYTCRGFQALKVFVTYTSTPLQLDSWKAR